MLDPTALQRIHGIGGPVLVGKMIDLLLTNAPQRLEKAMTAARNKDWRAVEEAVHSLKSSAGNVGAVHLQELAARIEVMVENSQCAEAESLLNELAKVWELVKVQLEVQRKGLESETDRCSGGQ